MAKDKLTEYSATNASNDVLGDISVAEGMLPSAVNNAIREQMTHLKNFADGTDGINVLSLEDDDGSHAVKLQAPSTVSTTVTYTLPGTDGTSGYVLTTNGSGALSWAASLSNVVEDTSPQLGADLQSNGNDILFADSDKAIFGAGSDLQIYHDGNSYIKDSGSGDLIIQASDDLLLESTSGENYINCNNDGSVEVFYNGGKKFETTATGVDVTGGLNTTGNVGIGTASPSNFAGYTTLDVVNSTNGGAILARGSTVEARFISDEPTGTVQVKAQSSHPLTFGTGGTERMRITSGGNVGIGTSSPNEKLSVSGNIELYNDEQDGYIWFHDFGTASYAIGRDQSSDTFSINRNTDLTTNPLVTVTSGGSVGISTVSPSAKLHVGGGNLQQFIENTSGSGIARLNIQSTTNDGYQHAGIGLQDGTNQSELMLVTGNNFAISHGGSEKLRITSAGSVGIGSSSPSYKLDVVGNARLNPTSNPVLRFAENGTLRGLLTSSSSIGLSAETSGTLPFIVQTNGSERLRVDGSGNVGIGTSPATILHVKGADPNITIQDTNDTGDAYIRFKNNSGTQRSFIQTAMTGNVMLFGTGTSERFRLDASGNMLVGTTTSNYTATNGFGVIAPAAATYAFVSHPNGTASGTSYFLFSYNGGAIGSISQNGTTAVSYNTSSDRRLKSNIQDAASASDKIDALQVRQFDWNVDGSHQDYGLIAQELQPIEPLAVSGDADSDEMMGVDYSKLVPMLIKEIQELRSRVATLEAN